MGAFLLEENYMKINVTSLPFKIDTALVKMIEDEINKRKLPADSAVTLNFRDPDYNVEAGGFHPVEVRVSAQGKIEYFTDFALVGVGEFTELASEIDFDFTNDLFLHFGKEHHISEGRELFEIWHQNFTSYHAMGIYEVECVTD
jgi:hypothetical protein